MRASAPTRRAAWLLATLFALPALAQRLPATAPTAALLPTGTASPAKPGTRRPEVTFTNGLLTVSATNASLNLTLREIGRVTGMKITGGVTEDRVFGTYGPAPASEVLASLLDGTGTNLLLVDNAADAPAELILTPRRGGPTPPNPNAAYNDDVPQQSFPQTPQQQFNGPPAQPLPIVTGPPGLGGLPPSNGGQTGAPINGGADLGTTPGAFVPAGQNPPDATAQPSVQPAPDPSQPQSPNGVSTPQQIYEQLMRLRQQEQQQQQNAPR